MVWKIAKFALCSLFVVSLLGCIGDDPFSLDDFDVDRCGSDTSDLSGIWTIRGEGNRTDCREDFLNTERFVIRSLDLPIDHDTSTGQIRLGDANFSENFRIEDGRVNGSCVNFTTVETTGEAEIRYDWEGRVENGVIRGDFSGFGPKTCTSQGDFTASY